MKDSVTFDTTLLLQIAAFIEIITKVYGPALPSHVATEGHELLDKIGAVLAQTDEEENDE